MVHLQFIDQPKGRIQNADDKKSIRQHAMRHSINNKNEKEVLLELPDGFGGDVYGDEVDELGYARSDMIMGEVEGGVLGVEDIREATTKMVEIVDGFGSGMSKTTNKIDKVQAHQGLQGSLQLSHRFEPLLPKQLYATPNEPSKMRTKERGFAPKVRTGCHGCKTRRIKCDETKPSCLRCLKYHGSCPGYTQPPPSSSTHNKAFRYAARQGISIERPRLGLYFKDDANSLYFQVFQKETSSEITGIFQSEFWTEIVMREAHRMDFVAKAIIALGALSKAKKAKHWATLDPVQAPSLHKQALKHRESALKVYGNSLRMMRSIAKKTDGDLRSIIIASLLIFAFETFNDQPDIAFNHLLIGDRLACNWLLTIPHSGLGSPEPDVLEDDILRALMRVDLHMMTFTDMRSARIHELGKMDGQSGIDGMPFLYSSIHEAKLYLELLTRRACHFTYFSFGVSQAVRLQSGFEMAVPRRGVDMKSGYTIYSSPYITTPGLVLEAQSYLAELERFEGAFMPLYYVARSEVGREGDLICASTLRMHFLATKIMVRGTCFVREIEYDRFLDEFSELVELGMGLTEVGLHYRRNEPRFGLDLGVVSPMLLVVLRCRDRGVRRAALEVLSSSHNREGPWDREMIARAAEWVVDVEERGLEEERRGIDGERDGKWVPEERRIRLSRVMIDMEKRRMLLQCVRRTGLWEGDEEVLEWEEGVVEC